MVMFKKKFREINLLFHFTNLLTFINCLFTFCSFADEHYVSQINPALNELGYDSVFKKRTGDKKDGCAIFYKREKVKNE